MKFLLPLIRGSVSLLALHQIKSNNVVSQTQRDYSVTNTIERMTATATEPPTISPPKSFADKLPPLSKDSRRIYLLRHGETDWNRQGLMQGGGFDVELNSEGLEQARQVQQLLQGLPIQVVACSHLKRSWQTAQCVRQSFPDASFVQSSQFGEMRFGDFEGIQVRPSHDERSSTAFQWTPEKEQQRQIFLGLNKIVQDDKHVAWPGHGGECVWDVEQRGRQGMDHLMRSFPEAERFCIVAHGRFNKILLQSLLGISGRDVFEQGNACVNVLDVDPQGNWKAQLINHMEHFDKSDAAPRQAPS